MVAARSRARRRCLVLVFVIASGFYYWTATSNGGPGETGARYYNELATALLHGHLALPAKPPKGLLALSNPYNPALNGPYASPYHDLALYRGHFYLSQGVTPAVTLFAPWQLLHLGQLNGDIAVAIFGILGLAFALALLGFLVDTYLPKLPSWQIAVGGTAIAFGNVIPFLLRRPAFYEVAIASGYCFSMASMYLLATGGLAGRFRRGRLAAGSMCAGLAIGGHPNLALVGLVTIPLAAGVIHRDKLRSWAERARCLGWILGPFCASVAMLFAYNLARFGSPFDFGQRYVLAGVDQSHVPLISASNLMPSLKQYVLQPVRWSFAFPHFVLTPSRPYPNGLPYAEHLQVEIVGGVLFTTPIVLALIALPFLLRRVQDREFKAVLMWLTGLGGALVLTLSLALGVTMRYEADFATIVLLAGLLTWYVLCQHSALRRTVARVGAVVVLYGSVLGAAISFTGYYDWLRTADPGTYQALQDLTSPLPTLATMVVGHPDIVRIIVPGAQYPEDLGETGTNSPGQSPFWILGQPDEVDIVSPSSEAWVLEAHVVATPGVPPGTTVTLLEQSDGVTTVHPLPPNGTWRLPVHLGIGLNRVWLSVMLSPPPSGTAYVRVGTLSLQRH